MTTIAIDKERCTNCSLCVQTCPSLPFHLQNKVTQVNESAHKECIASGQCIAVCHTDAITVEGLDPASFAPLTESGIDGDSYAAFCRQRRSVRAYRRKAFPASISVPVDHTLHAAFTFGFPRFKVKKVLLTFVQGHPLCPVRLTRRAIDFTSRPERVYRHIVKAHHISGPFGAG